MGSRDAAAAAWIDRFRRSKGGHLVDDPSSGRVTTIGTLETLIAELAAVEQGGVMQNLGLMTQAPLDPDFYEQFYVPEGVPEPVGADERRRGNKSGAHDGPGRNGPNGAAIQRK